MLSNLTRDEMTHFIFQKGSQLDHNNEQIKSKRTLIAFLHSAMQLEKHISLTLQNYIINLLFWQVSLLILSENKQK